MDASFSSNATPRHSAKQSRAFGLMKRGRILGLSKMLVKSIIFAIAGILATLVFRFISQRKAAQLERLKAEQRKKEEDLLEEEWNRINGQKQPLLQITPITEQLETKQEDDNQLLTQSFSLPWPEEESKTTRG